MKRLKRNISSVSLQVLLLFSPCTSCTRSRPTESGTQTAKDSRESWASCPQVPVGVSHHLKGIFVYPQPMWTSLVLLALCFIWGSKTHYPSPQGVLREHINNTVRFSSTVHDAMRQEQTDLKDDERKQDGKLGMRYPGKGRFHPAPLPATPSRHWTLVWSCCDCITQKHV